MTRDRFIVIFELITSIVAYIFLIAAAMAEDGDTQTIMVGILFAVIIITNQNERLKND